MNDWFLDGLPKPLFFINSPGVGYVPLFTSLVMLKFFNKLRQLFVSIFFNCALCEVEDNVGFGPVLSEAPSPLDDRGGFVMPQALGKLSSLACSAGFDAIELCSDLLLISVNFM